MKITQYILLAFLLNLMLFLGFSCQKNSGQGNEPQSVGLMQVEVVERNGETEDKMETVRFIVFKNASSYPVFELNKRFDIPGGGVGEDEVSKFTITLELSKSGGVDDKMVVAIVNEPAEMKAVLDGITHYDVLQHLELDFADFLNNSHSALASGKTMPMTGVVWTDKVYETVPEAEADPAKISVYRAAARVDIHVMKEAGLDITLASGTSVTLINTYDREYFVRNEVGSRAFGYIQTVNSGLVNKSWTISASDSDELPDASPDNGRLLCTFYTPERTCTASGNSDKLALDIVLVTNEGVTRTGEVMLDKVRGAGAGVDVDLDVILRNNGYRVITTIKPNSLTAKVLDWNSNDLEIEF